MAQWPGVLAALLEGPLLAPSTHCSLLANALTPAPEDLGSAGTFSGFWEHLYICVLSCILIHSPPPSLPLSSFLSLSTPSLK